MIRIVRRCFVRRCFVRLSSVRRCFALVATLLVVMTNAPTSAFASEASWTHRAETGPDHWAELDTTFALCGSGKRQSPTNLTGTVSADLANPDFYYKSVPLNLLNNGHTVQVPYAPGSYIVLEGDRYDLLQFHFHSPSEHTIDNQPWDAELHLVHQNDAGDLAVVAVLLQTEDALSSAYDSISNSLPAKPGDKIRTGTTINARDLLPAKATTYRYSGSLTTPPCSESVTWLVMTDPVGLSAEQMSRYKMLLDHNNRPLQLLNNRTVQMDISP